MFGDFQLLIFSEISAAEIISIISSRISSQIQQLKMPSILTAESDQP
jgi:hypothetical protein